jgi:hypothetical protein
MALPYEVQEGLNEKCSDRVVRIGDYHGIAHMLDHSCATGLSPTAIAAGAARLRNDPQLVALLQLRIANVETNLVLLTTLWAPGYRKPLRRLAQERQ